MAHSYGFEVNVVASFHALSSLAEQMNADSDVVVTLQEIPRRIEPEMKGVPFKFYSGQRETQRLPSGELVCRTTVRPDKLTERLAGYLKDTGLVDSDALLGRFLEAADGVASDNRIGMVMHQDVYATAEPGRETWIIQEAALLPRHDGIRR